MVTNIFKVLRVNQISREINLSLLRNLFNCMILTHLYGYFIACSIYFQRVTTIDDDPFIHVIGDSLDLLSQL